jgi:hypothetical protein
MHGKIVQVGVYGAGAQGGHVKEAVLVQLVVFIIPAGGQVEFEAVLVEDVIAEGQQKKLPGFLAGGGQGFFNVFVEAVVVGFPDPAEPDFTLAGGGVAVTQGKVDGDAVFQNFGVGAVKEIPQKGSLFVQSPEGRGGAK